MNKKPKQLNKQYLDLACLVRCWVTARRMDSATGLSRVTFKLLAVKTAARTLETQQQKRMNKQQQLQSVCQA